MIQPRRPSNQNRPGVDRDGPTGLRFGMFAACVVRDGSADLAGRPKELYILLVTYADTGGRDTDQGYPYRSALAKAMGCSPKTVDRATARLEAIGLVAVQRRKLPGGKENDANRYKLHDGWLIHGTEPSSSVPPQLVARYGHQIPGFDVDSYLGGGDTGDATPGDTGDATGRDMGDAQSRDSLLETSPRDGNAPTARSANDAVGKTSGSRDRGAGGVAASGKTRNRLSKAEYASISAVRDLLPDDLNKALPGKTPPNMGAAILEALAAGSPFERTVAQLVEFRVMPRWHQHWAEKFYAGELRSVVGPFLAMLKQQTCGDLSCEEKVNINTGQPCRACEQRKVDKRADSDRSTSEAILPAPRKSALASRPLCPGCERPLTDVTQPELCRGCRESVPA